MSEINELIKKVVRFRDERDWKQFHTTKEMATALLLESSELVQEFLWKGEQEITAKMHNQPESISDELMDVLYWVLLISHDLNIDIPREFDRKLRKNRLKYPIEKAKGRSDKYSELE